MQFTPDLLRHFFKYFDKDIDDQEIYLLLSKYGKWRNTVASLKQYKKLQKHAWIFRYIPGLRAVFLCNTGAFRASREDSDIDLFVVTDNRTLYITRIFLTCITHILGIRRHGTYVKDRFCLSFFATIDGAYALSSLEIEPENDPYLAVWTATLECIAVVPEFLNTFYTKNTWIHTYNLYFTQEHTPLLLSPPHTHSSYQKKILLSIETLFRSWLKPRAEYKKSLLKNQDGTVISNSYLKFHDNDIRKAVLHYLGEQNELEVSRPSVTMGT